MKVLYLIRHAKAEPPRYYDDDRDRELSREGRQDARRLGQFLAAANQLPDQFVTSTAVRARQTAEVLTEGGKWMTEVPLRTAHGLYQVQPADVLEEIQSITTDVEALMLVGHEPTWSTTVGQLVGAANVTLSPGTCVRIDVAIDHWQELAFGDGTLRWMVSPDLLR